MNRTFLATTILLGWLTSAASAQAPEILIPTGTNDGAFALVDNDADGKFTSAKEAWDWHLHTTNTSPKYYILLNGYIYFPDSILDGIFRVKDANSNGIIETTEMTKWYDLAANLGPSNPPMITMDNAGWMWMSVHSGTAEGVYKLKDLNNNGSAEDPGEAIAVLTETMPKIDIHNTPNTSGVPAVYPQLALTGIDYIQFDGTVGNGRFLCEDEASDQTICLEDKNSDGDFNDPGECYLFCALWNGGALSADINPDVTSGALPVANEIRGIVSDFTTNGSYMMSSDTTATNTDAGIIFRGVDGNADGDVNDVGETTIYWDGSLDSTGATKGYNFIVGMEIDVAGRLFVNAEWDATPDRERLLMIQDLNNDGDANDAGETTVLWEIPSDTTHYRPALLPSGTISPVVGTTVAEIAYYGAATCASGLPGTHNIQYGHSATGGGASKAPIIGNANWIVRTWGAAASANGAYGIGVTKEPAGIPFGPGGTCNIYNSLDVIALNFTTASTGDHNTSVSIPNNTALLGLWTFWQSIVADPSAPLGLTFSDAFEVKVGDYSYTK